jgi:hypothetical protein
VLIKKTDSHSACQWILRLCLSPKFHYRARHWSPSCHRWIHSTYSHHIYLTLILFSHLRLGLSSTLIPSGVSTKTVNAFLIFHMRVTYLNISSLLIWWHYWYLVPSMKLVIHFPLTICYCPPLRSKYSPRHNVLKYFQFTMSSIIWDITPSSPLKVYSS